MNHGAEMLLSQVADQIDREEEDIDRAVAGELHKFNAHETTRLEQSIIAAILEDGTSAVADAVEAGLTPSAFTSETCREFFSICTRLHEERSPIDRSIVEDAALKSGSLEKSLRKGTIDRIEYTVKATRSPGFAAKILSRAGYRREIFRATKGIEGKLLEGKEPDRILDEAQQAFFDLSKGKRRGPSKDLSESVTEALKEMPSAGGKRETLTCGLEGLDGVIGGFTPSELVLIAARPSMGKTALALSILHSVSVKSKIPSAFFSLEMSTKQCAQRLIGIESGISPRKQNPTREEISSVTEAAGRVAESPVFIDDGARYLSDIRARARRLVASHGVSMIFIDYLQLVKSDEKFEKRHLEVGAVSRSIKELAADLGVVVIGLSQLSRAVEGRAERRPNLSDLRESGDLEQDADIVQLIYREGYYRREDAGPDQSEEAEIIIAKNRNGPTGTANVAYRANIPAFSDLDFSSMRF